MSIKLLTFLGTSNYQPASYYFDNTNESSEQVHYVQETLIKRYTPNSVIVFVTTEAHQDNYENRRLSRTELEPGTGLQSKLHQLQKEKYLFDFQHKFINRGSDSSELWKVFDVVFQSIENEDEIIFDITHALRSLPMLTMVLINYAITLKRIKVKAICYGAFEVGEKIDGINYTPIFDLSPFVELQDWTYAAQSFIHAGDAKRLSALTARTFPKFSKSIEEFTQSIKTCRGKFIIDEFNAYELKKEIQKIKQDKKSPQQLSPLLDAVEGKLKPFNNHTIKNGYAAVEWCIQHDLIQQGITILQEVLISSVIEAVFDEDEEERNNRITRELANAALNGQKIEPGDYNKYCTPRSKLTKDDVKFKFESMVLWINKITGLKDCYSTLTGRSGFRNDINHAGFKDNPLKPEELREELQQLFRKVKNLNLRQ